MAETSLFSWFRSEWIDNNTCGGKIEVGACQQEAGGWDILLTSYSDGGSVLCMHGTRSMQPRPTPAQESPVRAELACMAASKGHHPSLPPVVPDLSSWDIPCRLDAVLRTVRAASWNGIGDKRTEEKRGH